MVIFGKKKKKAKKKQKKKEEKISEDERLEKGNIYSSVIIEVLGKPRKHVQDTLKQYVYQIKSDKNIDIIKEKFAKTKKQGALFSTFVELEIWFSDVNKIIEFCFDYMPSSVEIIKPEKFSYKNIEFSAMLNDLQGKLHQLDMIVKNLRTENANLKRNAGNLMRNIVLLSLRKGAKNTEELSKDIGIPTQDLERILALILKEGHIIEKKGKYNIRSK